MHAKVWTSFTRGFTSGSNLSLSLSDLYGYMRDSVFPFLQQVSGVPKKQLNTVMAQRRHDKKPSLSAAFLSSAKNFKDRQNDIIAAHEKNPHFLLQTEIVKTWSGGYERGLEVFLQAVDTELARP